MSEKQAINIAKGLAISAVVGLHLLSLFPEQMYQQAGIEWLFLGINQAFRFSVPLFLAVSGYGLTKKYQQNQFSGRAFLKHQATKIIPLYFIWSIILWIVLSRSNTWHPAELGGLEAFLIGSVDYHLYFVPLIFQCYLLFILLQKVRDRFKVLLLAGMFGLLQFGWFTLVYTVSLVDTAPLEGILLQDQVLYRLLLSWIFYFLLGMVFALFNIRKIRGFVGIGWLLIGGIVVSYLWSVVQSHQLYEVTNNLIIATGFVRPPILLYSTLIITAFSMYYDHLPRINFPGMRLLTFAGKYSYIIYLSHTLLLRIAEGFIQGGVRYSTLVIASILFLIGLLVSSRRILVHASVRKWSID